MPHKLLLADDSLTIQKVVELVLAPENFEIKTVNDGEQAVAALESFIPDIALADIEMPKINGYQLCEKIKNNAATSKVPVILLAGAFEPFDEEYAKSVGADDFIIKPFESQELISKVKALIASFEPSQEAAEEEIYEDEAEAAAAEPQAEIQPEEAPEEVKVPLSAQEPAWDQEIPPLEEKTEEPAITDEEYEAKAALIESSSEGLEEAKAFAEELAEALKMEEEPAKMEAVEENIEMPSIELPVQEISQEPDIVPEIMEPPAAGPAPQEAALYAETIKDSINQTISGIAPKIIEDVTRELVGNLLGSLRGEIDAAIRKIVPEVAENIIKKEIEKISSEIS
jgi:DNA-binding response OmpR family regulator